MKPLLKQISEKRAWTCPSCGHACFLEYCPSCGERRLREEQHTFANGISRILWRIISFDGRLGRTLAKLIIAPGELTTAYVAGQRRPFIGPFQLFLVINVVFFAVQSLGVSVFSLPLNNALHSQIFSPIANKLLPHWLSTHSMSLADYTPLYDHMQQIFAKSLVIVMVPLFTVAVAVLTRPRRAAVVHGVFAIHFYTFLMLFLCALFLALEIAFTTVYGHVIAISPYSDDIITGIEFIVCAGYLYIALGRVYALPRLHRLLSSALLMVAALYILYIYRFIVFLVTLQFT